MKKLTTLLCLLLCTLCARANSPQFIQFSHDGLNADAVTPVTAGTSLGSNDAIATSVAFDDSYKIVSLKSEGYGWVVVDGVKLCEDTLGIQGNTNPKDPDGTNPAAACTAPVSGAVFQVEAKADGWLYIVHKASSNKQYTVFENGIPIGYHFGMITVDANGVFTTAGEPFVIEYTIEGNNELGQITDGRRINYAEDYMKAANDPNFGTNNYTRNGLGVIAVPCYTGCTYMFNACGSKMSALGVAYYPIEKDVYVRNENGTEIKIYGANNNYARLTVGVADGCENWGYVEGGGDYPMFSNVTISAISNPGYHFVQWSDGNEQAVRNIYLQSNITLLATFAPGDFEGKCGPDMYWTWDSATKALNITGTGDMNLSDYTYWALWAIDAIRSINIAEGVNSIAAYAFSGYDIDYSAVKEVIIPASVSYLGHRSFQALRNAERIEYLGNTAQVGRYIGEYAMSGGNVRFLKAPVGFCDSETVITDSLIITNGEVTSMYNTPYMDLSAASNTSLPSRLGSDIVREIILPAGLETIDADALRNCRYLAAITIPAAVTEIGTSAFEDCRSLGSVTFAGKNLQTIGDWAFYNCHNLRQITLPEGLQEVGTAAFYGCTFLTDLTIPSTAKKIAENGFALCAKLQRMYVNALVPPAIEEKTFEDVDRSISVFVPRGTIELYQADQYWSEFLNIEEYDAPAGIFNTTSDSQTAVRKVLKDGQVLILRGEDIYTLLGEKLQ